MHCVPRLTPQHARTARRRVRASEENQPPRSGGASAPAAMHRGPFRRRTREHARAAAAAGLPPPGGTDKRWLVGFSCARCAPGPVLLVEPVRRRGRGRQGTRAGAGLGTRGKRLIMTPPCHGWPGQPLVLPRRAVPPSLWLCLPGLYRPHQCYRAERNLRGGILCVKRKCSSGQALRPCCNQP
jgi:hypothetical protein